MIRTALALLCCLLTVQASEIRNERIWTGTNGKTFRGIFLQLTDDDKSAQIASNTGKVFTVALDNLSEADRLLVLSTKPAPPVPGKAGSEEVAEGAFPGFKEPPSMPRDTIMPTTPESVGSKKSDELLDPMWQFVGWWDTEKVLAIPRDGDFDDRLEWAHERLARHCKVRTGGGVIDVDKLREGLEKYFEENLEDQAAIVVVEDTDFSPARLAEYATGMNAVVLRMNMTYANGRNYRACAALESIDEQGNAVLHLWGCRKNARIEIEKRRPNLHGGLSLRTAKDSYRVTLADFDDLPDYVVDNEATFRLDPEEYDTVVIAKPYLFAKEGARRPVPLKDPLFTPSRKSPEDQQVKKAVGRITLPIDFRSSSTKSRSWHFADDSVFDGKLTFSKDDTPQLRNTSGKTLKLDVESLTPEDQANYYFSRGYSGFGARPPRLELHYHLKTQHGDNYDFVITTEGSLARIDCPQASSSLTFDLKDQAYVATRPSRAYHGRWEANGLIPKNRFSSMQEDERHEKFSAIVRSSGPSSNFKFPARFASFPLVEKTFSQPRVDFTLMQEPTAMVAIYQILYATSPASHDRDNPKAPNRELINVFSNGFEASHHDGLKSIGHRFVDHYMLPLRMRWSNAFNKSWVRQEDRLKASGQFEFALTAAKVPAPFPSGHFAIPEAARKEALGTCVKVQK